MVWPPGFYFDSDKAAVLSKLGTVAAKPNYFVEVGGTMVSLNLAHVLPVGSWESRWTRSWKHARHHHRSFFFFGGETCDAARAEVGAPSVDLWRVFLTPKLHWHLVAQPCDGNYAPRFFDNATFGAASATDLWMACSQEEGIDRHSVTQVLRSSDGGRRWFLVAGTNEVRIPPNFPDVAYVPLIGSPSTSAFGSDEVWMILAGPGLLIQTRNGGRTWSEGAPQEVEIQGPLQVFSFHSTVIVRTGLALWTSTANHWTRVAGS